MQRGLVACIGWFAVTFIGANLIYGALTFSAHNIHWKDVVLWELPLASVSLFLAAVGTWCVWLIRWKTKAVGTVFGVAVAILSVALLSFLAITFFGGFEANMGYALAGMVLVLPNSVAGGLAGFQRAKQATGA